MPFHTFGDFGPAPNPPIFSPSPPNESAERAGGGGLLERLVSSFNVAVPFKENCVFTLTGGQVNVLCTPTTPQQQQALRQVVLPGETQARSAATALNQFLPAFTTVAVIAIVGLVVLIFAFRR